RLPRVEQAVAVGIAAVRAGDGAEHVVGDDDVGDRHVAAVGGDLVPERDRTADQHVPALGVKVVGELRNLNLGVVAGVAGIVVGGDGRGGDEGVVAIDGAGVGVLPGQGGGGRSVNPGL